MAAGYIPMSLLRKFEKETGRVIEFVESLTKMAVNGEESLLLAYTLEWTRTINRGGLFEINDEAYRLFKAIEIKCRNNCCLCLKVHWLYQERERLLLIQLLAMKMFSFCGFFCHVTLQKKMMLYIC